MEAEVACAANPGIPVTPGEGETADERVFLFGYGSLINNESRCGSSGSNNAEKENDALLVRVSPAWGYTRAFCARSQTGFTALGLVSSPDPTPDSASTAISTCTATTVATGVRSGIIGVIFEVNALELSSFDVREKAYTRVLVPTEHLEAVAGPLLPANTRTSHMPLPQDKVYTYIQKPDACFAANRDFPIIQTYVDACLSGCLAWGGETLMQDFVLNTLWWSPFFLNDCPLSRRPWLHRRHYVEVDELLSKYKEHTCMLFRKHAEEYNSYSGSTQNHNQIAQIGDGTSNASGKPGDTSTGGGVSGSASASSYGANAAGSGAPRALAGLWGCPPRNPLFAGREGILASLHAGLQSDNFAEISGLGGMGKSSLVSEYCNRHFGTAYGLVIYLRAESRASLAADIRKFSFDSNLVELNLNSGSANVAKGNNSSNGGSSGGGGTRVDIDDERLLEDFKRHLAALQTRCLIVFDNLECPAGAITSSRTAVAPYLPRGRLAYKNMHAHDINYNGSPGYLSGAGGAASAASVCVLVTRRVAGAAADGASEMDGATFSLALDALRPAESLQFLAKALQTEEVTVEKGEEERELEELEALAERLQHLPLALSQAAAFIKRTDVSAAEYLQRLDMRDCSGATRGFGDTGDALDSVYASLSMALDRIETESPASVKILRRLAWLSPDNITKKLVLKLLETAPSSETGTLCSDKIRQASLSSYSSNWLSKRRASALLAMGAATLGGTAVHKAMSSVNQQRVTSATRACIIFSGAMASGYCGWLVGRQALSSASGELKADTPLAPPPLPRAHAAVFDPTVMQSAVVESADIVLEADRVWELLKQFGLLTVRGSRRARVASIHRIQQQFLRQQLQVKMKTHESGSSPIALCVEHAVVALAELWARESQSLQQHGLAAAQSLTAVSADLGELLEHMQMLAGHVSAELSAHHADARKEEAPLRPFGMCAVTVLKLACLLTSAASYATLALSRFDMAESVLALALRLQVGQRDGPDAVAAASKGRGTIDAPLLARTYHLYGSISRLRGHFEASREYLLCALHIRQKDSSMELSVADTLHELGILDIRQGALEAAHAKLTESLAVKLKYHNLSKQTATASVTAVRAKNNRHVLGETVLNNSDSTAAANGEQGETSIGATLHQLAVIATFEKRYDDAERLLKQALALDAASTGAATGTGRTVPTRSRENTRQLVSRAAATQQLGRVYLRRGQLQQAKTSLEESLAIYTKAYGDMQHINVAAVHHQLGNTLSTLEKHAEAEEHFNKALSIRLAVFPVDHIEVIKTYTELAQCLTDKGAAHALVAEVYWEKQQERVEAAMQRLQVTSADSTAHAVSISHLARHLLSALYARRVYYRRRKDLAMVTQLSTSIAQARKLQDGGGGSCDSKEPKPDDLTSTVEFLSCAGLMAKSSTVSNSVREAVLAARTAVRTQAKALASSSTAVAAGTIMSSLSKQLEEILDPALASVEEDEEEGEVAGQGPGQGLGASGTYDSVYGNKPLVRAARRLCADIDALLRGAEEKWGQLRLPPANPGAPNKLEKELLKVVKELASGLFNTCDRLRGEVQALGETVED